MVASGSRKQTQDSRGGGSGGKTCSLPNGIRTGPVTNDVVANSRDQPHQRAHSTNAGTVTTTHGLPTRIAPNARAGPVPFACEAAQPPKPLTIERGPVRLLEIAVTRHTFQLSPRVATRMTVGANIAAPWPAVIGAVLVRTKVMLRVDRAFASSGEREDRWR